VRSKRVWAELLGVEQVVVESVRFEPIVSLDGGAADGGAAEGGAAATGAAVVVSVRPTRWWRSRCGRCRRRCPGYDRGRGVRWWRTFDVGLYAAFLQAPAPRVRCPRHGVVVAAVPWARHGAGHTRAFDDLVAWFATRMSKTALARYLRVGWATVGAIIARVMADADAVAGDRLDGITRIGVDEVSYKRGHKYLTVVVDHATRRVLWLAEGRSKSTLARFFELLGPQRSARIELVSADGADWIFNAVRDACPNAEICLDPFHVVSWAGAALDEVRRAVWQTARRAGQVGPARDLQRARYALWKNPDKLTDRQRASLASIKATNEPLYRAYLLKEQLRQVFALRGQAGAVLLDAWLGWAARSRLPAFVDLARRIRSYFRADIINTLTHRLSNGLIESTNTKIRLLTRVAFGFKSADALIALAKLHLGGYHIQLPNRT
jgi:transposase